MGGMGRRPKGGDRGSEVIVLLVPVMTDYEELREEGSSWFETNGEERPEIHLQKT